LGYQPEIDSSAPYAMKNQHDLRKTISRLVTFASGLHCQAPCATPNQVIVEQEESVRRQLADFDGSNHQMHYKSANGAVNLRFF
jgi:hypothetical protein